jgi:hypothetical protein
MAGSRIDFAHGLSANLLQFSPNGRMLIIFFSFGALNGSRVATL